MVTVVLTAISDAISRRCFKACDAPDKLFLSGDRKLPAVSTACCCVVLPAAAVWVAVVDEEDGADDDAFPVAVFRKTPSISESGAIALPNTLRNKSSFNRYTRTP